MENTIMTDLPTQQEYETINYKPKSTVEVQEASLLLFMSLLGYIPTDRFRFKNVNILN